MNRIKGILLGQLCAATCGCSDLGDDPPEEGDEPIPAVSSDEEQLEYIRQVELDTAYLPGEDPVAVQAEWAAAVAASPPCDPKNDKVMRCGLGERDEPVEPRRPASGGGNQALRPNERAPALFYQATGLNVCASTLSDGTMHTPVSCPAGQVYDHGPERCLTPVYRRKPKIENARVASSGNEGTASDRDVVNGCEPVPAPPKPWPSYSEELRDLCRSGSWYDSGFTSYRGECADGKRFLASIGSSIDGEASGETRFYDGENLIGSQKQSEGFLLSPTRFFCFGSTGCAVVEQTAMCGTPPGLLPRSTR